MKRIYLILLILNSQFSILNSLHAQEAFYIYQNDGHFDGFFYDEVLKMSYSKIDTAGVEYDVYVTQEIITADSTYRIMLSAIDSVGFVQPEIKYNPHVYIRQASIDNEVLFEYMYHFDSGGDEEIIVFYRDENSSWLPQPQVGDVFADFDVRDGWSAKIASLTYNYPNYEGYLVGICKPIDDITDIFQQFVSVEQYGYEDNGQMVHRRVAGHPELNVGEFPKRSSRRASEGQWEGDLFNFSLNGHIPLYTNDDLSISIDPAITGKLHIKTVWNLSWLGDKYIGITTKLDFGVSTGFTVDGQIKDFFPGGVGGLMGGVPVPATCPLLYLDVAPDAFIRGDAHVKFSAQSPTLKGGMWGKLEINNWWPSMNIGFGEPDGKQEFVDKSSAGLSLELNGYVQGGMLFPMTFKSLPVIQKFFDASTSSFWFVGPKLAGAISLDLATMPWEDEAAYTLLKNTKLSLHMLDADYEVKAKVKTLFSGKKEVTLLDGSFNIFPPLDAALVPEFEDAVDYEETRYINGKSRLCRIIGFKPKGYVTCPVRIRAGMEEIVSDGTECHLYVGGETKMYYHIAELLGQELPKHQWAEIVLPYRVGKYSGNNGKFKARPVVGFGGKEFIADKTYDFELPDLCHPITSDTLYVKFDGNTLKPVIVSAYCDKLINGGVDSSGDFITLENTRLDGCPGFLTVLGQTGTDDEHELTIASSKEKFEQFCNARHPGMSRWYNCKDSLIVKKKYEGVWEPAEDDVAIYLSDLYPLVIVILPNSELDPVPVGDTHGTVTRLPDNRGWHFKGYWIDKANQNEKKGGEFDILSSDVGLGDSFRKAPFEFKFP